MSRIARWKIEKTKVKVVFRLQFHATHIPQSGWDKLFISFIPADSGKATAKTTKANVRNGTCKWGDPIYETTRLLQDIKTKQFDEKLYKLVVSMGSSRSSVFGEATINLADYADASQPSAVALPLHGCDSGAILHVTIQLLTSKTGFREFEQQREIREKGFQSGTDPNGPDQSSHRSLTEEVNNSQVDKVNARVRFREKPKEHQLLEDVGLNGEYSDSAVGFDGSSNTSESFNAEKHDTSSTHEIDSLRSTASGELAGLSQSPQKEKGDLSDGRYLTQGANNLVRSWSSDYSVDNDIINAYEENIRLRGCLEMTESSVNELKAEVCSLKAHSDEMSVETQMFAQQLAAEIASGEELAKEVSVLKLECSKLKSELDQVNGDKQIGKMSLPESDRYSLGTGPDPELFQPDLAMLRAVSIPSQVSNEPDSLDAATAMKEKIFELLRELDESKAERESLAKKMDQMECYYEALVQELEENQRQMLGELQSLRNEHSTCLYTFQSTKVEMETMHREMNKQILRFSEEKTELESMTKELERRAITAEAAVKRARLNYSIAVEQLQKDLEVLSFQVLSMYETHENLIKECIIDSPPTSFQGDPKMMQNRQKLESEEFHSTKLLQCQNHYAGMKKHRSGDILLEDMQKSLQLQEGIYRKVDEEVCEMHYVNVYLDVFSSTLKETLLEASCDARLMKKRFDELTQQQELLMESKELVLRRLQTAMDDIHFLNEEKTVSVAKCDEMAVEKQNLEANLEDLTHENSRLTLKINEMESMIMEYKIYKNKYDACAVEKTELANLLREETQENGYLRNDISSTQEELKKMTAEFEEVITVKKDLQNTLDFLQNRLQNLLSSYDQSFDVTESDGECFESKDLNGLLVRFEGMQNIAVEKILQLSKEKKDLMDERDKARESLSMVESDKLLLKETFEHDVKNMNVLFQKLQLEIEAVSDKLKFSSEVEENHARQQETLLSEFNCLEVELQQLTSKNGEITQEIFALESINHELENSKLQISELEAKNKVLTFSLQDKSEELSRLSTELNCLKESLQCLQDELLAERSSKDNLESIASDRSMHFDQQKSELVRLEEMVSELESEKSRVCHLLQDKSEESSRLSAELDCLKESLQCLQDELLAERSSKDKLESIVSDWSMHFDQQKSELIRLKEMVSGLESEKSRVCHLLQDKSEESSRFSTELNCLKESLKCLQDELLAERSSKDKLESIVADRSMHFEQQKSEVARLKEMLSELELEKSRVCRLLLQSEEHLKNAGNESSSSRLLEAELSEMLKLSVAADVSLVFVRTQYEAWTEDLVQKLKLSRNHTTELQYMYLNVESMMNRCLARESHYTEENAKLLTSLNSLKSDLEAAVAENKTLLSTNCASSSELEIYKRRFDEMKVNQCEEKRRHALQFERVEQLLVNSQEEIDNLLLLKEEHEVELLVLKSKLEEQSADLSSSEGYEVILLQNQCTELSQKLSEQILRTAEFRNLSIHLRELKDKAEEECAKAREKRDSEAPLTPTQESLRIVFIKEQYETKLQEIKRQLAVSKKHREEMLWKLQDAVDEVENKKKSEASHLKKNEELGMKILELEAELQEVSSDKREKVIVYDRMKAELECSMISLDCCKEEKQKLEASLQECIEEKKKISDELSTAKQLLEDLKSNGVNGDGSLVPANQEDLQSKDSKFLALFNDQFRAESLRSSLDHLNNELERMKNENLHDSEDDNHFDQKFPGLERELMQLSKVNDELATIYPFFNGYSATGNALQRVLALEIELAESLQNKRKSNFNFQSSFLKQHGDEEAIFKSFRDINELIKDMLELKGRYSSVETELKEMHGRYSQLSIQFAEVEGERQKLMMTLKSVRAARNNQHLIRSSSATLGDQS